MINLSEKLGEMTFDGLITDIKPCLLYTSPSPRD